MKSFYQKGASLLEIMIGVAIVAITIVLVVYSFYGVKNSQSLKNGLGDMVSSINKARSMAFASVNSTAYGIRFESNRVIIFSGTTYTSGASGNEIISISTPASITNVTLAGTSGTSGDFYFNRLTGVPSKTGTVTITSGSITKTITIGATGIVSVN